ncbi:MAG: peptidyl-tRNA hydrolase Pth2 [Candidatus Nanohalobium sp.]
MSQHKQAIVLRTDLGMSTGKMIAQACHASLKAYKKASSEAQGEWESGGQKKVVLDMGDGDLQERFRRAKRNNVPAAIVKDAGLTEVKPGTKTALGVGPAEESKIDSITRDLKLLE